MASIKWSDHAMARMREQAQYIARESCSTEIAWKWANDIFREAETLAEFPDLGHKLPEFPSSPYLEILVRKNFRLIYRKSGETCLIVTVRRCSMVLDDMVLRNLDSVE